MTPGTPKNISEAISNGLETINVAVTPYKVRVIKDHLRDFLAQKFMVAMLEASRNRYDDKQLKQLFDKLVT